MMRAGGDSRELWVCWLGTVAYRQALAVQAQAAIRREHDQLPDTLLLLEHPPVYTRGRRSRAGELPLGADFYRERGIEVVETDRGGRVTYHGPGQLVGYPIMRVSDVVAHVRALEDAIVAALADVGVRARSRAQDGPDYTGVWVQQRKIASIGVHVRKGVTTHGFAVNVDNDLEPFSWIVPCGLPDVVMTSVRRELEGGELGGETPADVRERLRGRLADHLAARHGRRARTVAAGSIAPQRVAA